MKGLQWEVDLRFSGLYYKGRGDTPEQALQDLTDCMNKGIEDAREQLVIQNRRFTDLTYHLSELRTSGND